MVYFYVVIGHIPNSITRAFNVVRLLVLTNPYLGIWPIIVGEVLYWLVSMTFCFQFHNAFLTHLSSPHQFKVAIKGGCETMVYDIWVALNVSLIGWYCRWTLQMLSTLFPKGLYSMSCSYFSLVPFMPHNSLFYLITC